MDKVKSYAGQFLLVTAACLVALWGYDYMNKPKAAAPATTPAGSPAGAPAE